ncbi:MAG: hypothetical protein R6T99_01690 [Bacteroidales bacterium]
MILEIILALAGLFGIFWSIRSKQIIPTIITLGMVVGIIFVLYPPEWNADAGFYVYLFFTLVAMLYGLIIRGPGLYQRLVIVLMALPVFLHWLFVMNHWPGNTTLLMILPVIVFIAGLFHARKFRNEMGFLVILFADAVTVLLEQWVF